MPLPIAFGGAGNDTLNGGAGIDALVGGTVTISLSLTTVATSSLNS